MNDSEQQPLPVFLWFDSEFTCLDIEAAHLLQVALIATDSALQRVTPTDVDMNLFVELPDHICLSEWTQQHIPQIIAKARSDEAIPVDHVDQLLFNYIQEHIGPTPLDIRQRPILAGNSIHADLAMIRKQLPQFASCLHYRMLDVSALKIMWQHSFKGQPFIKEDRNMVDQYSPWPCPAAASSQHDALFDIYASMAEYAYYCRHLQMAF